MSRLIDLCQKVKNGGFSCSVRADKSAYFTLTHGNIEIIHRFKSAELNSKMPGFKHRRHFYISFGKQGVVVDNSYKLAHSAFSPFTVFFFMLNIFLKLAVIFSMSTRPLSDWVMSIMEMSSNA